MREFSLHYWFGLCFLVKFGKAGDFIASGFDRKLIYLYNMAPMAVGTCNVKWCTVAVLPIISYDSKSDSETKPR